MSRAANRRRAAEGRETPFSCEACGRMASADAPGTRHRNHCPHCLASLHLDVTVGDRRSGCRGVMDAIALWVRDDGEPSLVHRCRRCGRLVSNRVAGDDDATSLRDLARRSLAAVAPGATPTPRPGACGRGTGRDAGTSGRRRRGSQ